MDPSDAIQVLVLLALIGLSAFFSSAETALVTVNKIRIRNLIDEDSRRAITLSKVTEDQGKMLSAILIGNNIVNISASSLSTILVTRWLAGTGLAALAAGISTGVLTLLVLVFGEITPKTCATIHSEKIALAYAPLIYGWMLVATPLIFVMNNLSMGILFLMRVDPGDKSETYTEEEIRTIVEVSHEDGVIEPEERMMINNVFDFGDATAKDIMVPKVDMSFLNVTASYSDML
ncbi:MAG: CNNM domain-containing protein [Lachnospiraceae bacterium]|nr:CNNM domain-containing protein [Lachnospiraceae bacterium]